MRVCVTGATSGIGTNLVSALRARGDGVTALVRKTSATETLYRLGCDLTEGDVMDVESLRRAAGGADVMVHAAARVGSWGPREGYDKVNVRGTENALTAAREAGVQRFVLVSSTAVYGDSTESVLTESLGMGEGGGAYAGSKRAAERVVFERGGRWALGVTAVRPSVVYGPYDKRFLPRLAGLLRAGRFVWVVDPETPLNLAHAGNVVDVILRAMEHPEAVGEAFNVSDGTPRTLREVVDTVCRHLQVDPPTVTLPRGMAELGARVLENAWRALGKDTPPWVTRAEIQALGRARTVSTDKARRVLGYHPVVDTLEGLGQACDALT